MKKLVAILTGCLMGMGLHAQVINDPNAEPREAKNFYGISVSDAFDVYITQGNEEGVAVSSADGKEQDRIEVAVKNGILTIGLKKGYNGRKRLAAYVSFKTLTKMRFSDACDVYVEGVLKTDNLTITCSGASDLKKVHLDVKNLTVDLSSASDMTVLGSVQNLKVQASGASEFHGVDLTAETCDARASGASEIRITVNRSLQAQASGASEIRYRGNAALDEIKASGGAGISRI